MFYPNPSKIETLHMLQTYCEHKVSIMLSDGQTFFDKIAGFRNKVARLCN